MNRSAPAKRLSTIMGLLTLSIMIGFATTLGVTAIPSDTQNGIPVADYVGLTFDGKGFASEPFGESTLESTAHLPIDSSTMNEITNL